MESIYCCATHKGGKVRAYKKDFVMANALKQYGLPVAISLLSLLPLKDTFAQSNDVPGDDVKSEWVVNGNKYISPGASALRHSESGTSLGLIVHRGQNDFDKSESEMVAKFEAYMQRQGINGKVFIETIPENKFSQFMIYVNGETPTRNPVYSNEFMKLLPQMIQKQRDLDDNRLAARQSWSLNQ